jgi:formylglycine-generating enzyme required for sulfatase activity
MFFTAPLRAQTPSSSFRDCADCPEMVVLPPGSFLMGSTPAETDRERIPGRDANWERPRHMVEIRYSLAVARTALSVAQWKACLAGGGCNGYRPDIAFRDGEPDATVLQVSWLDAQVYVAWLNAQVQASGSHALYRLPTEAEWEYAARAGTTTARWWGDKPEDGPSGFEWFSLKPESEWPINPFGLQGMLGSHWQWTADCWVDSYANAPADGSSSPDGNCQRRTVRGGMLSWRGPRSAARSWRLVSLRSRDTVVRVVRSLP